MNLELEHIWLMLCSFLVFSMQAGFLCLETGLTRSKNNINVALKNVLDFVICILLFWAIGYGIAFGSSYFGLFGTRDFFAFTFDGNFEKISFFLLQVLFCCTSVTIVSGAVAERVRFNAYIMIGALVAAIIYPVFTHWSWSNGETRGWLKTIGFFDCAGSTVVHGVGGWIALATVLIIGPRKNAIDPDTHSRNIYGYNLPIAILGTLILFIGWLGFNIGSTIINRGNIAYTFINTMLSGTSGGIGAYIYSLIRLRGKLPAQDMITGILSGLVSITASCYIVSPMEAIVIGLIGGIWGILIDRILLRLNIDDAVAAIPVHLGAGIWGTVAVGLFGDETKIGSGLSWVSQIGVQLLGVASGFLWAFGVGFLGLFLLNKIYRFRVSSAQEFMGLNIAEHDAKSELFEFLKFLDLQSKSGDLSLRASVEQFTEIGVIAHKFNHLVEKLEITQNSLKQEKENIHSILQNMKQGIFTLDRNLTIQKDYSSFLEQILDTRDISGQDVFEKVFNLFHINNHDRALLKSILEVSLGTDLLNFQMNRHLLLKEVRQNVDGEGNRSKIFEIDWEPIVSAKGIVEKLMVVMRDVTLVRQLQGAASKKERALNILAQIVACPRKKLRMILKDMDDFMSSVPEHLEGFRISDKYLSDRLHKLHSLKGNLRMLGLNYLTSAVHDSEQYFSDLSTAKTEYQPSEHSEELRKLSHSFSEYKNLINSLPELEESPPSLEQNYLDECILIAVKNQGVPPPSVRELQAVFRKLALVGSYSVSEVVTEMITGSTQNLPKVYIKEDQVRIKKQYQGAINNILIHCLNNVSAHTVPKDPLNFKEMFIAATADLEKMTLQISDNGRGLDKGKILPALSPDPEPSSQMISSENLTHLLCSDGFSTAGEVTHTAGRGAGLGAIKDCVRELHGRVKIIPDPEKLSEDFLPFVLSCEFPAGDSQIWFSIPESQKESEKSQVA